jgi:hypothetical protein
MYARMHQWLDVRGGRLPLRRGHVHRRGAMLRDELRRYDDQRSELRRLRHGLPLGSHVHGRLLCRRVHRELPRGHDV